MEELEEFDMDRFARLYVDGFNFGYRLQSLMASSEEADESDPIFSEMISESLHHEILGRMLEVLDLLLNSVTDDALKDEMAFMKSKLKMFHEFRPPGWPKKEPIEWTLHYALRNTFLKVSIVLMELGWDVNERDKQGLTPLGLCLRAPISVEDKVEMATALLCHGADPRETCSSYNAYEYAIYHRLHPLEEIILDFMIDEYNSIDMHFNIILILAKLQSPLLSRTLEHVGQIIVGKSFQLCVQILFSIDVSQLDILIKKCPSAIREVFSEVRFPRHTNFYGFPEKLENVNFLLESSLRHETVDLIRGFGNEFFMLSKYKIDEEAAIKQICLLLSYGMSLTNQHLLMLYRQYGFGELMKMLLHIEIEPNPSIRSFNDAFLLLLYDVNFDLKDVLERISKYGYSGATELLPYFANDKLRLICSTDERPEGVLKVPQQPDVPLLVQLARDAFRIFFIRTLKITSARQYYRLIDQLKISPPCKDIIIFKKELYPVLFISVNE